MLLKKIQRITSNPTGADLYIKRWGEWVYLGKTPYNFDMKRDRGGWVNPEFLISMKGYKVETGIVDRSHSEHHFLLRQLSSKIVEPNRAKGTSKQKAIPINPIGVIDTRGGKITVDVGH